MTWLAGYGAFLARRPGDLYGVAVSRLPPKSDRNGRAGGIASKDHHL